MENQAGDLLLRMRTGRDSSASILEVSALSYVLEDAQLGEGGFGGDPTYVRLPPKRARRLATAVVVTSLRTREGNDDPSSVRALASKK